MSKVATRWQVMKVATAELGYVERGGRDGRSGNITKYWKAHYPQWQGQPWCGAFIYWVLRKVGVVDKRSEEHTSELQSRGHLVCRLLLEKKNNTGEVQRRTGRGATTTVGERRIHPGDEGEE